MTRPRVLGLEQGTLAVQAAGVAGDLPVAPTTRWQGMMNAQRVAAYRRADVPRLRPGPQAERELAVGRRLRRRAPRPPAPTPAGRTRGL
jgi:hypothetical protein